MTTAPDDRARLALTLKNLRVDAGLSTTKLAERLNWSQSKVSKTERGTTLPPPEDVEAWARELNAPTEVREELVEIATQAAVKVTEWRQELAPGRRRKQEDIRRMEAAASVIRVFSADVIVGLAQIRPYIDAMFQLGRKIEPAQELPEDVIRARLERAAVLDRLDKHFEFLMGEQALRRRLIPDADMRRQVEWLIELSYRPNIVLEVIPFRAVEKVHQYNGFAIIGDPDVDEEAIVLAETVTRGLTIRSTDEIREHIEHFNALRSGAIRGNELREFLQEVIKDLPG